MKPLSRPARRATLFVHVAVSVGWLGLTLGLLVLGLAGALTRSPTTATAAYRAMKIFGDWLIIPISLLSLFSGVILSLGTAWGIARYRWVYTKFWLTLIATGASIFALRTTIDEAASAVATGPDAGAATPSLVAAPSVALTLYVFMTAISVLKPWGPTARGRRARAAARTTRTARTTLKARTPRTSLTPRTAASAPARTTGARPGT
ncbi:hypothetical protein [Streptomyces varsoviensis]|uniref:Membrane protein n=1 Tax=Streptomyces varsoviensis TaxID=67373 RepID=A0ABR5J591_9ACTN|nr:hypothetical protein [Streptomyces varsoviensis]KOG88509.1 membrane protein [Streptomyces varsoviensis]